MHWNLLAPTPSEGLTFCAALLALALATWLRRSMVADAPLRRPLLWTQTLMVALLVLTALEVLTPLPIARLAGLAHDGLNFELTVIGEHPVTPMLLIAMVLLLGVTSWTSTWARRSIEQHLQERQLGDPGTVAATARLIQYVLLALGLAVGLSTLGIDLSAVLAAGAVFAVGIGLAMQQMAENFVSGVILLVERSIRPGDVLEVDGQIVRVQHLGLRATVVRSQDDEELIVPNSLLVQNQVKNLRLSDSLLRVRVPVGVAYRTDLRAAFGALERAAAQMPSVSERTPVVNLLGFGDSAVQLEVSIWVQEPWEGAQARSQLALRVWDALHEAGIEIAFPQLDVHLDPEGVGALAPASSPPAGR